VLVELFGYAASFQNCPKQQRKLAELLDIWDEKGYYSGDYVGKLRETTRNAESKGGQFAKESDDQNFGPGISTAVKDAPFVLPASHGDPNTPYYDLPAGNLLPHIIPNTNLPIDPHQVKPLHFVAGPADENLATAVKHFLVEADHIYTPTFEAGDDEGIADIDELGQVVVRAALTDMVIGDGYYGWSRAFCKRMSKRKNGKGEEPRVGEASRRYSDSSSQSENPLKRRRYSDSQSISSRSRSQSRSRTRSHSLSRGRSPDNTSSRARKRSRRRRKPTSRSSSYSNRAKSKDEDNTRRSRRRYSSGSYDRSDTYKPDGLRESSKSRPSFQSAGIAGPPQTFRPRSPTSIPAGGRPSFSSPLQGLQYNQYNQQSFQTPNQAGPPFHPPPPQGYSGPWPPPPPPPPPMEQQYQTAGGYLPPNYPTPIAHGYPPQPPPQQPGWIQQGSGHFQSTGIGAHPPPQPLQQYPPNTGYGNSNSQQWNQNIGAGGGQQWNQNDGRGGSSSNYGTGSGQTQGKQGEGQTRGGWQQQRGRGRGGRW
jgi:CID domain